jgi:hypothetical protein
MDWGFGLPSDSIACTGGLLQPASAHSSNGWLLPCSKIAEAEAAVSVNEKKWLVMHMHVQLQLDELV